MTKEKIMFRRKRLVSHDPGVLLCTLKLEDYIAFGIARQNKDKKEKINKKLGHKIAEKRARKVENNLKRYVVWIPGEKLPDRGLVSFGDLQKFLIEFHKENFIRD